MIRQPLRKGRTRRITKKPVARVRSIPAPHGGWNTKDAISDMPATDAVALENMIPRTDRVQLRRGYSEHVTGITGDVETLMEWAGPASNKFFAAANNEIYDVTSPGAVGAAVVTSLSNNRWQHVNFSTAGGDFLVLCNGEDSLRNYNGSTWTAPSITGVTSSTLINVAVFKRRLLFCKSQSLSFYYLPVSAISGAASEFTLGEIFRLGGYLMAIGTWTLDAGDGADDLAVFISSKGEVAVYKGSDPGDAGNWSLQGVYRVGQPVGRRCLEKYGGDLVLINENGYMPLSSALITGQSQPVIALSNKINSAVTTAIRDSGSNFGWQAILYPKDDLFLFNVPETAASVQHVMETESKSWCKFIGLDAKCFGILNGHLYFGGNTAVYKADDTLADNDTNISWYVKPAYNYMGGKSRLKHGLMARPVFTTEGNIGPKIKLNFDFEDLIPTGTATFTAGSNALWNSTAWNSTAWAHGGSIKKDWQAVDGEGYALSLYVQGESKGIDISLNSIDYMFEPGGYI
jgi:hypothetical protein